MKPNNDPIRAIWWCVLVGLVICGAVSPAQVGAQRGRQRANASDPQTDQAIHIVPLYGDHSVPTPPAITSAIPNLTWHGGPVQHTQKVYTIFWDPASAFPANYQTTINQFVQDLSGSSLQALMTQYTDGGGHVGTTLVYGGTWLDTTNAVPVAAPNAPSASDLLAEVGRAKTANPSWTDDANTYYQVFTPPTYGTNTNYCGYHQFNNPAYGVILYPAAHNGGSCIVGSTFPHTAQIDMAINVTSHEIFETLTDPLGTGWWNSDGNEIGDLCNFTFGTQGVDGSNITLNTRPYLAQQEWSNAVSACSLTGAGILAGSGTLVTESIPNSRLDPGELVSTSLCMNSFYPTTSGSITGTLQASGGVTSPSGAQSYGTIAAFGNACHTYSFTVGSSCGATLTATLQDAESGGPTKNLTYSFQVGSSAVGAPFSSQNFDGVVAPALPAGWTTSTLTGTANLFVTNATGSDTAPNRAATGDPASISDNVLLSPSIAIPAGGVQLSFRHSFNFEAGDYDGGVLEIAINGGGFADIITAGGAFVAGGYTAPIPNFDNPLAGRSAWTSNSSGYITTTITLPAGASGQNIQLRWRAGTDSFNDPGTFTGWSIDTITLSGTQLQCGGASPVTLAATNIGPNSANLNATVNPNGTSTTAAFDYGTTTGYGTTVTATTPGSGSSPVAVSRTLNNLTCNTLYHFRSTANNTNGPTTGPDLTFTTAACPAPGNYVLNGNFGSGTTNWQTFALPAPGNMTAAVNSGVMEFARDNTSTQGTVFQTTGVTLPARTTLALQLQLGNTSLVRKYVKVLVTDSDFSDFAACTFWLAPSSPLQNYQMFSPTTKTWANASVYVYASTKNVPGDVGVYQVDNVTLGYDSVGITDATQCADPSTPMAPGGAAGPNLLTNGDFATNLLPPWTTFGTITASAPAGVLQMIRADATPPSGVIKQQTSSTSIQAMTLNQIMTASFQLGNSSGVRKRVTAIMHDNDFSDLVACVFWLRPGQPLSSYSMVGWASKAWVDATVSFYAATIGPDQWTLLDNVTFKRTPGTTTTGSQCFEPFGGASQLAPEPRMIVSASPPAGSGATLAQTATLGQTAFASRAGSGGANWVSEGGFARSANDAAWEAVADATGESRLAWGDAIDLRGAAGARLTFASWLSSSGSQGAVQASSDGVNWTTVSAVPSSDGWQRVDVDLSAFAGDVVHVQLVFDAVAPDAAEESDSWQVDDLAVEIE